MMRLGETFVGSQASFSSRTLGELKVESVSFSDAVDGDLAVYFGEPFVAERPLVRIHSECIFAEVFDSALCDCADQLEIALNRLSKSQQGILFYLRVDGRGAGLAAKVAATALEVAGADTYDSRVTLGVAPEGRDFDAIGAFLAARGVKGITLLTNNPLKIAALQRAGINVAAESLRVPVMNDTVRALLETKRTKFGHLLS
jgi:GTP cyclohydrolase II